MEIPVKRVMRTDGTYSLCKSQSDGEDPDQDELPTATVPAASRSFETPKSDQVIYKGVSFLPAYGIALQ